MASKPISIHQFRRLIGFLSKSYCISETVRLTGMARNTIMDCKRRIEAQGLRPEDVMLKNDEALAAVVQGETKRLRTEADEQRLQRVLDAKILPEQTYNSCLGILRLGKYYGTDQLEAACHRALTTSSTTYGIINNILKNNQDNVKDLTEGYIPRHENICVDAAYQ